jgi:hypothetical protein
MTASALMAAVLLARSGAYASISALCSIRKYKIFLNPSLSYFNKTIEIQHIIVFLHNSRVLAQRDNRVLTQRDNRRLAQHDTRV